MKLPFSIIVLMIGSVCVIAQTASDRTLAGLRGNVKTVETSSQETDARGKPAYPVEKQSTDEYDEEGNLVKSTYHVSRGRSIYFKLDGNRVSKYEQFGPELTVQTVVTPAGTSETPGPEHKQGDPRYEHKFTYKYDRSGRITEIDDHKNDGSLWQTRKFTYDEAGRLASETVIEKGRPSHGDIYKYDGDGTVIERGSVFFLFSGEKEVTPFQYSKIKLDSKGNWTERTVSQSVEGKPEIISIETRKIKYY
jgi:hypothetical protein